MSDKTSRRELMRPVQLLGLAFGAALFAGLVTLVSMGFFQQVAPNQASTALVVAGIVAGVTFVTTLVVLALLLLAVNPADFTGEMNRPVLLPEDDAPAPPDDTQPRG